MQLLILTPGTVETFVEHWSQWYFDPREELYTSNIGRDLTPQRIRSLFEWKKGGPLPGRQRTSVETNYIGRLTEVAILGDTTTPGDFLRIFDQGGAIWRIFWLHCWKPERFPIYDQHVYRAMEYIIEGRCGEIPKSAEVIVASYINRYLPFWGQLPELPDRLVDQGALGFWKVSETVSMRSTIGRLTTAFTCRASPAGDAGR